MEYKVGLVTRAYVDETRESWNGTGPRPLRTDVWYPAEDDARETETFIGTPEAPVFRAGLAAREAVPRPGRYPVVLLSHGTGGSALQMGWLARFLAARGYIAAGVNHHGNNALEPFAAAGFLLWWERARDLSAMLDRLLVDPQLSPLLDGKRVGAAGFSLGGYTVIELAGAITDLGALRSFYRNPVQDLLRDIPPDFPNRSELRALAHELLQTDTSHSQSFLDARVGAVMAIAPALARAFGPAGLAAVTVPVKIVVGGADQIASPETDAIRFATLIPQSDLTILDGGVAHYTFLAESTRVGRVTHPDLCLDAPGVDRAAVHRRVGEIAVDFFRRQLETEGAA